MIKRPLTIILCPLLAQAARSHTIKCERSRHGFFLKIGHAFLQRIQYIHQHPLEKLYSPRDFFALHPRAAAAPRFD